MSEEMSNDPLAAILDRYGPVNAAKSLSQRLTTTEISELAYPEDTYGNDRFQMVLRLGKAIDRGELTACGTAAPPAYLTLQGVKHGPRQPLIDRADFARFVTALGTAPSGRLAEWLSQPDGSTQQPVAAGLPGRPSSNAEAYRHIESLMATEIKLIHACLDAAVKFFPNDDCQQKANSLAAGFRQYRKTATGNKLP